MTIINSEGTIPNECNTLGIVPFEIICHMFLSPPKSGSSLGCPSFCGSHWDRCLGMPHTPVPVTMRLQMSLTCSCDLWSKILTLEKIQDSLGFLLAYSYLCSRIKIIAIMTELTVSIEDVSMLEQIKQAISMLRGVSSVTLKRRRKTSMDRAIEDIEQGRVYKYDSLDDLIKEIEG